MSDQNWVERFGADVDHLFKTGRLVDSKQTPAEYSELLALAQTLSSDFSDQSQIRTALRRRLLAEMDTRKGWHPKEKIPMFTLFKKRRLALLVPAIILAGLLIVGLAWPGGLTAAVQDVIEFVQRLWVGEHTSIEPTDSEQFPEPCKVVRLDDRLMQAGELADGSATCEATRFDTITNAQAAASFTLRQPSYLPEGYIFSHARVRGSGDLSTADLYYGPDGRCEDGILLSQSPIGGQPDQEVSIGLPRVSVVETVVVNGHSATWAEGTLLWEAGDISYFLTGCADLGLAEAVRIAESLE